MVYSHDDVAEYVALYVTWRLASMKITCLCFILVLCIAVSIAFADDLAPTIGSVTLSPQVVAAGDMIHVAVQVQDDVAVASVTANSQPLWLMDNVWQGYVPADSVTGPHGVVITATDTSGNSSTDSQSQYTTQPVVGISNSGAASQTAQSSSTGLFFKTWGRATYIDSNYFFLDDGSKSPLKVYEPGHIVKTGDYATARGKLKGSGTDLYLDASDYDIVEFVGGQSIQNSNSSVGYHLESSFSATFTNPPTIETLTTVTLKSLDPGLVMFDTQDGSTLQSDASVVADSGKCYYSLVGLASSGTARISAISSDGHRGLFKVNLVPTGFVFGDYSDLTINPYSTMKSICVSCALLDPVTHMVAAYAIGYLNRGLPDVYVNVAYSDPSIAKLNSNPLEVSYCSGSANVSGLNLGSTVMSLVTPPGFTTPAEKQNATITVIAPRIYNESSNIAVGRDLQVQRYAYFDNGPSPTTDVTISVDDDSVATLSTDPTQEGSKIITLSGASGKTKYYIQGRKIGTTVITKSAPGYSSATDTVTVNPSGFMFSSPDITTNDYAANTQVSVGSAMLKPDTLKRVEYQPLRAGLNISVPISSSDINVGTVAPSAIGFAANTTTAYASFDPVGVGSCVVSIQTPPGFDTPSEGQSISATVNLPKIKTPNILSAGKDLESSSMFALESVPPEPVDVTVSVDDPSVALISNSSSIEGVKSFTFTHVNSASFIDFVAQGVSVGTTNIRISAQGYSDVTVLLTVYPSGFLFGSNPMRFGSYISIDTTTMSTDTSFSILSAFCDSRSVIVCQPVRPGVEPPIIKVLCSDTSVGNVVNDAIAFIGGSQSAGSYFHPLNPGNCTLSIIQPDGFVAPTGGQTSLTASVRKPYIVPEYHDHSVVGVNMEAGYGMHLEVAPSPVSVTMTVADESVATVAADFMQVGSKSCTINNVRGYTFYYFIQGLKEGNTTLTLSAPGYADRVMDVVVCPSGFAFYNTTPQTISLSTGSRQIYLCSGILNDYNMCDYQAIRVGVGDVSVPVYCSDPSICEVTRSPAVFTSLSSSHSVSVDLTPKAVGSCTLLLDTPDGWSELKGHNQLQISVIQ